MGLFRQEYWSWLPFPSPGDLPKPGTEAMPPALKVDSLPSETPGKLRGDPEIHQIQTVNQANQKDWPKKLRRNTL